MERSLIWQLSAIDGKHGELHRLPVEHGQRAGQSKTHRAHVGIRGIAKLGRAAAENLGLGQKLDVHFQPDDRLVLGLRRDGGFRRGDHISDYNGGNHGAGGQRDAREDGS